MKTKLQSALLLMLAIFASHGQAEANLSCNGQAFDACEPSCESSFWANADYLYWKIKRSPETIPFVVEGPVSASHAPVLGQPGYSIVLGDKHVGYDFRSGGRFELGYWLCPDHTYATEVSYLFLTDRSKTDRVSSSGESGSAYLAIPYIDATTNIESSTRLSLPGMFSGAAALKTSNKMQGAEWNGLYALDCGYGYGVRLLSGLRWWNFSDHLTFSTNSPDIIFPDVFKTKDRFSTYNNFYGCQVGIELKDTWEAVTVSLKGKVAIGAMHEALDIKGRLYTDNFSGFTTVETYHAGYFAMATNNGHGSRTRFAAIPEMNVDLSFCLFDCLNVQAGYTFLYVTNVLWAEKQVDRKVNTTQAPAISGNSSTTVVGSHHPKRLYRQNSLWAQGLNLGINVNF